MLDRPPPTPPGAPDAAGLNLLEVLRLVRVAGRALLTQISLHRQLACNEWAEEKRRLGKMLTVIVLGFACLLCFLLAGGALLLGISWDTPWRLPVAVALVVGYGLAAALAWRRLSALSAGGSQSFAATRAELAADLDLLRSKL